DRAPRRLRRPGSLGRRLPARPSADPRADEGCDADRGRAPAARGRAVGRDARPDRGRGPHVRRDAGGGVMARERVIDIPLVIVPDTGGRGAGVVAAMALLLAGVDRKSTRLNSSHVKISYAVFCLKKKNRA